MIKAFERYITRDGGSKYDFLLEKLPNGAYKYVNDEWESWKAAVEWYVTKRHSNES